MSFNWVLVNDLRPNSESFPSQFGPFHDFSGLPVATQLFI